MPDPPAPNELQIDMNSPEALLLGSTANGKGQMFGYLRNNNREELRRWAQVMDVSLNEKRLNTGAPQPGSLLSFLPIPGPAAFYKDEEFVALP